MGTPGIKAAGELIYEPAALDSILRSGKETRMEHTCVHCRRKWRSKHSWQTHNDRRMSQGTCPGDISWIERDQPQPAADAYSAQRDAVRRNIF